MQLSKQPIKKGDGKMYSVCSRKLGSIPAILMSAAIAVLGMSAQAGSWDEAGKKTSEAASAVGDATSESAGEAWDATKEGSEKAWDATKEGTEEAYEKAKKAVE
jgi:hypothetical protein